MKWSDTILCNQPLRDVSLLLQAPAQNWNDHVRQREQAAYERGRRDGERALGEQLIQQRAELAELQHGLLESIRRTIPEVIQATEQTLIDLAFEAAQKVVAQTPINAELIESVVREAIRQVEDTAEITIQLHPEDLATLRERSAGILEGLPETGPLKYLASAEVTRGGCLVQTRFGLLDARRETKLEQLRQTLNQ